ncbi:hypothetical protein FISHEDRAFT_57721 [Fistulina hepatica ATCC 64428]|uniref:Uncharacterized protein n=1 Tax=Fistulina hepatica ATCC 64428 TaxID=1128425 RepID=A0A0D7AG03_9AGAR|nr:hypothetical protein FISHEDRAFT_57721 [Fistulina hepatica ATCC 64428]
MNIAYEIRLGVPKPYQYEAYNWEKVVLPVVVSKEVVLLGHLSHAYDPTQFIQQGMPDAPHPIFGRGGIAMPGISTRSVTAATAEARHRSHGSRPSTPHRKSEDNVPSRPRSRSRSRRRSYPKDDDSSSSIPATTGRFGSDTSFSGYERHTKSPGSLCPSPRISTEERRVASPPVSARAPSLSPPLAQTPVSRRSLGTSPPSNAPIHKLKSPISTPALARRIDPELHSHTQGLVMLPSNPSPAFLRQPAQKAPTPSLNHLRGRGFVQNMIKAHSQIDEVTHAQMDEGIAETPEPEMPRTRKPSVLDRWQPHAQATSAPSSSSYSGSTAVSATRMQKHVSLPTSLPRLESPDKQLVAKMPPEGSPGLGSAMTVVVIRPPPPHMVPAGDAPRVQSPSQMQLIEEETVDDFGILGRTMRTVNPPPASVPKPAAKSMLVSEPLLKSTTHNPAYINTPVCAETYTYPSSSETRTNSPARPQVRCPGTLGSPEVLFRDPKLNSPVMTSEEESSDFVFSVTIVVQTRNFQDGQITMQSHAFQHLKTNKTNVVQRNGVWCIHCATLLCAIRSQVSEPELLSRAAGLAMNMGIHLHPDIHNVIFRAGLDNWFSARLSNTRTPTFGADKTLPIYGYRHLGQLSDISSSLELPARVCSILRPLDMLAMDPDSGHQDTITFCRINAPFFDDPDFTHHFLLLVEQDDISHLLVPAARTGSHSTSPAMTDDGHLGERAAASNSSSMLSLSLSEVGLQNATIGIQYICQYINTVEFNSYVFMKWSVEFLSLQPEFSLESSTSMHMPDTYTGSAFGSTSSSSDSFQMNDYESDNVDHSFDELFNNLPVATPSSEDAFRPSTSTSVYRPISHRDGAFISAETSVHLVSTVSFDNIAMAAGVTSAMASDARGHSIGHHRSLWDSVLQYYGLRRVLDRIGISLPAGTQTIASHSLKSGVDVESDIYECFQYIRLWFKQGGYIDRHQRPNPKALDVYERGAARLTMHKIEQNTTDIRTQQI